MMKCPSSKGGGDEQTICNLTIVNLSLCVDIEIVKEMLPLENVLPPEPINIQKVSFLYLYYEPNIIFHCSFKSDSYVQSNIVRFSAVAIIPMLLLLVKPYIGSWSNISVMPQSSGTAKAIMYPSLYWTRWS